MLIHVKNIAALALAVVCADKPRKNVPSYGVRFEPDGTVAGSNGQMLAWHPEATAPFEGEAFTLLIDKAPPKAARAATIDTEAGTIEYTGARGFTRTAPVKVLDREWYPDFRRVTPVVAHRSVPGAFGIDAARMAKMASAAVWGGGVLIWQFAVCPWDAKYDAPILMLGTGDPRQVALIVGARGVSTGFMPLA